MKRHSSNKEVVLGVTGSIAAYKACELASRLTELGCKVQPVLTKSATELVGPATFEAITGRRCITEMFEPLQNPDVEHIAVAQRADLFIIAPATANILAKAANGIADDWLSTTLLATRAPILFAPAMNSNMYTHPATEANIATLKSRGCHFVGPDSGRLACRTIGPGRLIDPAYIIETALPLLNKKKPLAGRRVLITSGGTREPIDPVRYIGNRSSGKMGRALALEALMNGAEVTVVTGPSDIPMPYAVKLIQVDTAAEMAAAVFAEAETADIVISAAAVADYRVANPSDTKKKRDGSSLVLDLVENPDILATLGTRKRPGQLLVGFAAETDSLISNAQTKYAKKNLDIIVANLVGAADSSFGLDTLRATIIGGNGHVDDPQLLTKDQLAERLIERVASMVGR